MFGYTGIEDVFLQKATCSTNFKQITNIRVKFEQIHPSYDAWLTYAVTWACRQNSPSGHANWWMDSFRVTKSVHVVDKLLYFHFKTPFPSQVSVFCFVFRTNKATLPWRNVLQSSIRTGYRCRFFSRRWCLVPSQKSLKCRFRVFWACLRCEHSVQTPCYR